MAGKFVTKEEFLNAVSLLRKNDQSTTIYAVCPGCCTCDDNNEDDEFEEDDYNDEFEDDETDTEAVKDIEDEYDEDIESLEELFCISDAETWKEFVYEVINEGYGDIPSHKIAEFVNDEFNVRVSAGSVAAVKANAARL